MIDNVIHIPDSRAFFYILAAINLAWSAAVIACIAGVMTITLADAEQWRHVHRHCHEDGTFRSLEQARFVTTDHSGHGCKRAALCYLAECVASGLRGDV